MELIGQKSKLFCIVLLIFWASCLSGTSGQNTPASSNNSSTNGTKDNTASTSASTTAQGGSTTANVTDIDYCVGVSCTNGHCVDLGNNYTCECNPGWTGVNCTEDVHECEINATICGHGYCSELLGSYECLCLNGWEGDNCDMAVTDYDHCQSSPCADKDNYYCYNTADGYLCACDVNLVGTDNKCEKQVMWPDYNKWKGSRSQGGTYTYFNTIPYPYYDFSTIRIQIYGNGYVSFGEDFKNATAPMQADWPFLPKLFGVYWADTANSGESQSYIYTDSDDRLDNLTAESSLIKYVKDVLKEPDFEPLYVLAATWENLMPKPAQKYPNETATFQVILATDSDITYAIRSYQKVWRNTDILPYYSTAYSLDNGNVHFDASLPSSGTVNVVKLGTGRPGNKTLDCVQKTQTVIADLGEYIKSLPPCPCYLAQAVVDPRFEISEPNSTCYQSKNSSGGGSLLQLCCFNEYGLLIGNSSEAKVPVSVDPHDSRFQSAFETCCAEGSRLCDWFYSKFQSSNCKKYIAPFIGAGFGDSHIVTFDNNKYSFGGLGDFVMYETENGSIELQGRTAIIPNKRTPSFVALALKAGNTIHQFYLKDNVLYFDGHKETTDTATVQYFNYTFLIRNTNGVLSCVIKLLSKDLDSVGLLGSFDGNAANDFKFRNGTVLDLSGKSLDSNGTLLDSNGTLHDSNETLHDSNGTLHNSSGASLDSNQLTGEKINAFAESWRVDEVHLLINISDSQPYDVANNQSGFTPFDLAVTPEGVLEALGNDSAQAKTICGSELFCLQDYYINRSITSATDVLKQARAINILKSISSEVPRITNSEAPFGLFDFQTTYNFWLATESKTAVTFNVSSVFQNIKGFSLVKNTFTWNVNAGVEELRNISYPQKLIFYVTDENNLSATFAPVISLCLCQETSQCQKFSSITDGRDSIGMHYYDNGLQKGNVNSMRCNCGSKAEGKFCEKIYDKCDNCYNKTKSACDVSRTNFCPPCPNGYEGDGILCRDKDECAVNNGGCRQICTNSMGSYSCSCEPGYRSDDNDCIDINECDNDADYCTNPQRFCNNLPGSASCDCYPGLVGDSCIKAPYAFIGSVKLAVYKNQTLNYKLLVKTSKEFRDLARNVADSITTALINGSVVTSDRIYVEVLSFDYTTETTGAPSRRKRETNNNAQNYISAKFVIYTSDSSITVAKINTALKSFIPPGCTTYCEYGKLRLFYDDIPKLDSGADHCQFPDLNKCDASSSTCSQLGQTIVCKCKKGYTNSAFNFYSCRDIDECAEDAVRYCPGKEACINTPGSYKCECNKGNVWNATTLACVADICSANPCKNNGICQISNNDQGFVCSCTYGWNGPVCDDEDTDARRMKIAVICVSVILGFCCLALFIIVLVLCLKHRSCRPSKQSVAITPSGNL